MSRHLELLGLSSDMLSMTANEARICERQSGASECCGLCLKQWTGIKVAWNKKYLRTIVSLFHASVYPEMMTTYKTYHAASLKCDRDIQYSSTDKIVSFAASRHLKTAKLSVLDEAC